MSSFFFLYLVKKSKFRRTTDAVKSTGPHDGTRNRRASSKIHCKKAAHSGCNGCEEKKTAKLLSLISFLFVSMTILETKKPLRKYYDFFLISKICALQPGSSQKLMMVQTQVNSQKTELNTVSTVFSFLNDENSRSAFFSISVSCIPALKLCCKTKAVFRNLENPKLLLNCTALKGFMLQYSLFFSNSLFIVSL